MPNKYLVKIANTHRSDALKDATDVGVIASLGTGAGLGAHRLVNRLKITNSLGTGALIGGAGLVADYAGIKINKALSPYFEKNKHETL